MNIFFLNEDPVVSAQQMVDKHVVKMILESAQMLSTAHRILDGKQHTIKTTTKTGKLRYKSVWVLPDGRDLILYKATHINHPSSKWVRESIENYNWLVDHLFALGNEYTYRYNKKHATIEKLAYTLQSPPYKLEEWDMTPMPCAMDDQYIISHDPIENYKNYYNVGKSHLHKWTKRDIPEWIK